MKIDRLEIYQYYSNISRIQRTRYLCQYFTK